MYPTSLRLNTDFHKGKYATGIPGTDLSWNMRFVSKTLFLKDKINENKTNPKPTKAQSITTDQQK